MGLGDFFKKTQLMTNTNDRKKPNMVIIWIIIAGIIFLAFGNFSGSENEDGKPSEKSGAFEEGYESKLEKRLEVILKKINGAGDVSVFICLEDGGEKVLARDSKSKLSEDKTAGGVYDEEVESSVVMGGKSSEQEPYVIEEKLPHIAGVLVVAKGAADERVRLEIYEAVKAVCGVSAHRIKVTY